MAAARAAERAEAAEAAANGNAAFVKRVVAPVTEKNVTPGPDVSGGAGSVQARPLDKSRYI